MTLLSGIRSFESVIPLYIDIVIATYSLSFFGFKQEAILEEQRFVRFVSIPDESGNLVRTRSNLDHPMQKPSEKKPYLIHNLTLQDVANELSITAYRLSEIINNDLQKNYFTLINEFRMKEAKCRILSEDYIY